MSTGSGAAGPGWRAAGGGARPAWVGDLRAVTLDFGNTLVRATHEDLRRIVEATVDRVLGDVSAARRAAFLAAWAEERDRQFAEEVPQLREVDMGQRFVRVYARTRGMAVPSRQERWDDEAAAAFSSAHEVETGVAHYVDAFVDEFPVPPEVGPLLADLASRYWLAVLSNWPVARAIERYVEEAGWSRHLTAVVVSERVGTIKPEPAIFRAAEAALTLGGIPGGERPRPEAILHVGDDWAADVVGAKRAGWRAAYLRDRQAGSPLPSSEPDGSVTADLELASLGELRAVLLGSR